MHSLMILLRALYGGVGGQTRLRLIRLDFSGCKKKALDSANYRHNRGNKPGHVHVKIHWERQAARYTYSHTH